MKQLKSAMCNFGYVRHKHLIYIFGGEIGAKNYIDDVYMMDLSKDESELEKLQTKCPAKSAYSAAFVDKSEQDSKLVNGYIRKVLRKLKMNRLSSDIIVLVLEFYPFSHVLHLFTRGIPSIHHHSYNEKHCSISY